MPGGVGGSRHNWTGLEGREVPLWIQVGCIPPSLNGKYFIFPDVRKSTFTPEIPRETHPTFIQKEEGVGAPPLPGGVGGGPAQLDQTVGEGVPLRTREGYPLPHICKPENHPGY